MKRISALKTWKLSTAIFFGVTAYLSRNFVKQPVLSVMSNNTTVVNHPPVAGSWRGVLGSPEFPVEADRYHLYAAWFCPFAGRVLLTRQMKGLQDYLPIDIVRPYPKPWLFPATNEEYPGATVDRLFHSKALSEIYHMNEPGRKDKFSVPLLWDKKTNQIVNNESEDIMRMLNTVFNDYLPSNSTQQSLDFYPPELRPQIDAVNLWLMPDLNNGVYKAGFAPNQEAYEPACRTVFDTLARVSQMLSSHNKLYLLGSRMTEVDLKLYCTLIRFDAIYVQRRLSSPRKDYSKARTSEELTKCRLQIEYWHHQTRLPGAAPLLEASLLESRWFQGSYRLQAHQREL